MIKPSLAPVPPEKNARKKYNANSLVAVTKRMSLFFAAAVAAGSISWAVNAGQMRLENFLYAQISEPIDKITYTAPKNPSLPELDMDAKAVYSLRINPAGRERVIFEKNIEGVLSIASLTKLMAAIVVLENPAFYAMDKTVIVDSAAAGQDDVPVAGNLRAGETASVRQLLGMMLHYSSNDAAYALSEIMGTDEFVAAMNRKAADLGLGDTEFYNPSGLDRDSGESNHSSAGDLMALAKFIMQSRGEIFSYTVGEGDYATQNGIFDINLWDGQKLVGGKTGYTEKAGGCMIYVYEIGNGSRYVNIVLGSTSSETRVVQMQKLINCASNGEKTAAN